MAICWQIGDQVPDPSTGQDRWEINNILGGSGKSGMGIVYVVFDSETDEAFAAKTFQDEAFAHDPQITERFAQEALAWVNLDMHENVAKAHFVHNIRGKPYLFLEFVSGGDLSQWIGTSRLIEDLPQVLNFAIQFCNGMICALSKGIEAHRDIKPQNCLITQDNILKVTDFGLAKVLGKVDFPLARAGTLQYMAPEQFRDPNLVDVRADIYSFGVMLFQMVTGRLPFRVYARNPEEVWGEYRQAHQGKPIPEFQTQDKALTALIEICIAKDPVQRFKGFEGVRERLVEIYERLTDKPVPEPTSGAQLGAVHWSNKGLALWQLGYNEEALQCYQRALQIDPHNPKTWYNMAGTLIDLEKCQEASDCCDRAIELDQHSAAAWSNKGVALAQLGQLEDAMRCLDHAILLNPRDVTSWSNRSIVLWKLGEYEGALACLDQALELSPQSARALLGKGMALAQFGRWEEAPGFYDRALEINPHDAAAWLHKGLALGTLGQLEASLDCFECALKVDRGKLTRSARSAAYFCRGMGLGVLGRHGEGLDCFDRFIELNPHRPEGWFNKGLSLGKLGRHEEALDCFDHALEFNPDHGETWYNKGVALRILRRIREALECFGKANQLRFPLAAQEIERCQQMLGDRPG